MTPEQVLAHMNSVGLSISLDGDDLIVSPPGVANKTLIAHLRRMKPELVAYLRMKNTDQNAARMTPEQALAHMEVMDLSVTKDGSNLRISPPAQVTSETRAVVKANAAALEGLLNGGRRQDTQELHKGAHEEFRAALEALQGVWQRELTPAELQEVKDALKQIRNDHGWNLVPAGWTRDVIFSGQDPTACRVVGDIPNVIAVYMAGGKIVEIHPDRLVMESATGVRFIRTKDGLMIG